MIALPLPRDSGPLIPWVGLCYVALFTQESPAQTKWSMMRCNFVRNAFLPAQTASIYHMHPSKIELAIVILAASARWWVCNFSIRFSSLETMAVSILPTESVWAIGMPIKGDALASFSHCQGNIPSAGGGGRRGNGKGNGLLPCTDQAKSSPKDSQNILKSQDVLVDSPDQSTRVICEHIM